MDLSERHEPGTALPPRPDLFFQRLLDNLPAGAYTCDADGLITYYNRQAVEIWGREPKLNDPVDRFCGSFRLFTSDGAALQHDQCWMALALRDERGYNDVEIIVERPDGGRSTVLAHANPIHDETGKLLGAVNMLVDISDRKLIEEASARLAAIVESSDDGIISKTLDGVIRSWNRGAEKLFGYTAAEAIGQHITLIIPADRHDEEAVIVSRISRGERIEHYETVRQRRDGSTFDISLTISPIVDAQGRIVGASKIARDITDRKAADLALKEQAHTLALINQIAGTLAAELDLERVIDSVTSVATELSRARFGAFIYKAVDEGAESYGLHALAGVGHETSGGHPIPRNTPLLDFTFRGEGVVRSDDITGDPRCGRNPPYFDTPEGRLPARSYMAVPVVSRTGEVIGGLFFVHEREAVFNHQAEQVVVALASHAATAIDNARLFEEAQRLNETLEEQVERRTADLSALNEELETFNYSVAHDLRGSLRGIDGFSQVILEECADGLNEDGHRYLARVRAAAQRMGHLLDNLLELSKLTRVEVERDRVDLGALARAVMENLREWEPERPLEVVIEEGLLVDGDGGLLRIALENILGNAWKFTGHAARALIEVGSEVREGERTFYVRDNGVGFDRTFEDKLFKPFQRLHSPGEFEGTGIGLATVQRIVHKHGGRIWAESEPGKGACFYFTLDG